MDNRWVVWQTTDSVEDSEDPQWIHQFRLQAFRIVSWAAAIVLSAIVFRSLFVSRYSVAWSDALNAAVFLLLLFWNWKRPDRVRLQTWIGFVSLYLNTFEGVIMMTELITPTHLLLPLMVLYGALMSDLRQSILAVVLNVLICTYSMIIYAPLSEYQILVLTNICIVNVATLSAVWLIVKRLQSLAHQAHRTAQQLRGEFESRHRLNAVIFHDIRNPLTALLSSCQMAKSHPGATPKALRIITTMGERINAIIESVRGMQAEQDLACEAVTLSSLESGLLPIFENQLEAKELTLDFKLPGGLTVLTKESVLVNSVLGNLLTNAIKFSHRGGRIEVKSMLESEKRVRISIVDEGKGFPARILEAARFGSSYTSTTGTEGELGSSYLPEKAGR